MTGRAPQQQRSQQRRATLLDAAVELIAEGGVQSVTHRSVAARAGLTSSSAGYFFASINDLTAEALRLHVSATVNDFLSLIDSSAGADRLFDAIGRLAVDPKVELTQLSLSLEASRNPAMREPVAEAMEAYRAVTEKLLRSVGLPLATAASSAFVALFQGFMLQHLARPDDPPTPAELADALRALFTGYLTTDEERLHLHARLGDPHPASSP